MYFSLLETPIGELVLVGDGAALSNVFFTETCTPRSDWRRHDASFAAAREQLEAYFAGDLTTFDLPLAPHGTAFQRSVWQAVSDITYGQTSTYGGVAGRLGVPRAYRAVGAANGRNPIPIIIPCHRVLGSGGGLTGYGGGLHRKQWLLDLEARR